MNNPFRKKKAAPQHAKAAAKKTPARESRQLQPVFESFSARFVRFTTKDQTLFAKRLSFLIKAGVPVSESMHMIYQQARSAGKKRVFAAIAKDVTSGQYLSASLAKHRQHFGDFAINLIRVGEQGGVLSSNLAYLAEELQKRHELRRKVIGALVYPIFISIATLGVTSLLTVYIFPKLMPIFTSLHVDLPLTTRILIGVAAYLRSWGILTLIGIIVATVALFVARAKLRPVRYWLDKALLYIPIVSSIARRYNLTNFCRTLGLLTRSGIRLSDAIGITTATTSNLVYKEASERMAKSLVRGESLSKALEKESALFPGMLGAMVAIGEKTGNLSSTLTYLAELYEGEVEELTKSLSSSIEPILMIVMGILVGLIAVSVITPIYSITQHLSPK